jgi:hypothetical protein
LKRKLAGILIIAGLAAVASLSANDWWPQCESYQSIPVCGPILDHYRNNGGPEVFGYPITAQLQQDGQVVQYFEKAVLQLPEGSLQEKEVRLRSLGLELAEPSPAENSKSEADCRYFDQYGHYVCLGFFDFFVENGGLDNFGWPISAAYQENGAIVQNFENVQFKWIDDGIYSRVELADWGRDVCELEQTTCGENRYQLSTYSLDEPSSDPIAQAFSQFMDEHGGRAVFGAEVGPLVHAGNQVYQYYRNACLVYSPGSNTPVTLASLGLLEVPYAPPVPAPEPADHIQYFPDTGHTVMMAFLDFYLAHGGVEVFGNPVTEFTEESGLNVQWFENVRFEWQPDMPNGQRVQLTPLGEINYQRSDGALPNVKPSPSPSPTPLPQEIALVIVPEHPLLEAGTRQRVTLLAYDPQGELLPGISLNLHVTTGSGESSHSAEPTDHNGRTVVDLGSVEGYCGERVSMQATYTVGGVAAVAQGQFDLWCGPSQAGFN